MKLSMVLRRRPGSWLTLLTIVGVIAVVVIGSVIVAGAQAPPPSPTPSNPNISGGALDLVTNKQFVLTFLLLAFGAGIIYLEYLLVRNRLADKIDDLAKFFVVTLIIIGTLVLVAAGYSSDQIAPVIGLFGTVAGYLLGRNSQSPTPPAPEAGNGQNEQPPVRPSTDPTSRT